MKITTYQAPSGQQIDLTTEQVDTLRSLGVWPRTERGEEYCQVSHGLHVGTPSYSSLTELLEISRRAALPLFPGPGVTTLDPLD